MGELLVRPEEGDPLAGCPCCAGPVEIRGFIFEEEEPRAIYFVQPLGVASFPMAKIGVVYGLWAEGTSASDRLAFAVMCRPGPDAPLLEPIDPPLEAFPEIERLGQPIACEALASHPNYAIFRALADAILAQDWRLAVLNRGEKEPFIQGRFRAESD